MNYLLENSVHYNEESRALENDNTVMTPTY